MKNEAIDFVLLWVDGNDPEWQKERSKYVSSDDKQDGNVRRYRDWENLQYWFRGVEKFAPWVRKIHLVTCGQIPKWLNTDNPKLNIVDHKDFIPAENLPTFNSNAIEVNLHRIESLSEQFVLFNDDMFLTKKVEPTDFFIDGKPVDMFMEYPVGCYGKNQVMSHIFVNNFNLIGKYFTRKQMLKELKWKILNPRYGFGFFYNLILYMLPYPNFFGVLTFHFAYPHLKSAFAEMWEKEGAIIKETSGHRFRDVGDISHYIFRMWLLMSGQFVPRNRMGMGKLYHVDKNAEAMYRAIKEQKHKMICVADEVSEEEFLKAKKRMLDSFATILPKKSKFEL